jgi:hypothetical protein
MVIIIFYKSNKKENFNTFNAYRVGFFHNLLVLSVVK